MFIGLVGYSPASVNIIKSLVPSLVVSNRLRIMVLSDYGEKELSVFKEHKGVEYVYTKDYNSIDLIIYSNGSSGDIETSIPFEARQRSIKTVHIQDIFWKGTNFEGYGKRFKYVPDYITTITEETRKEIISEIGIPDNRVMVLGNPYFDRLVDFRIPEGCPRSVSFISQCGLGGSLNEPTSDECQDAILELVDLLNRGIVTSLKIFRHPRENLDFYLKRGIPFESSSCFTSMMKSDIIISCGSTPHYEAMLIGKRTLFADKGNLEQRILNYDCDSLGEDLKIGGATERVVDFVKSLKVV